MRNYSNRFELRNCWRSSSLQSWHRIQCALAFALGSLLSRTSQFEKLRSHSWIAFFAKLISIKIACGRGTRIEWRHPLGAIEICASRTGKIAFGFSQPVSRCHCGSREMNELKWMIAWKAKWIRPFTFQREISSWFPSIFRKLRKPVVEREENPDEDDERTVEKLRCAFRRCQTANISNCRQTKARGILLFTKHVVSTEWKC